MSFVGDGRNPHFVVDDAPRIELWSTRRLTGLDSGDPAFRSLARPPPFWTRVGRVRLVSKVIVADDLDDLFGGDAVVVRVSSRPRCSGIRTVEELGSGLIEIVASRVSYVRFGRNGANHILYLQFTRRAYAVALTSSTRATSWDSSRVEPVGPTPPKATSHPRRVVSGRR
jgi:hypothetical protein